MKKELIEIAYSLKYMDEWQPKTTLYRHKPALDVEGNISFDVGTFIENVPGSPDYTLKKAKIGLFQWPPSDTCECRWCKERLASSTLKRDENGKFVKKQDNV